MRYFHRLNDALERIASWIVSLFMGVICLVIFANVFGRYVLHSSPPWSEELARYMMVWISALGAAVALRRGAHVGLDIVVQRLPARTRLVAEVTALLFALALTGVIAFFGFKLAAFNMRQHSAAMRMPMGVPYASVPTAGLLMVLVVLEQILTKLGVGEK
ncbi:MAG TPA: TRAP transporter small permease [Symbiobacteriaceae bacterium]